MHGDQQVSKNGIVYTKIRVRIWEKRKARFKHGLSDYDDVIERPSRNLGVDAHQSYQRKRVLRELLVEALLRLK